MPCAASSPRPTSSGSAAPTSSGELEVDGDIFDVLAVANHIEELHLGPRQIVAAARLVGWKGLKPLAPPPEEARLHGRRHSRDRDAAAIAHHYDVSNDFYRMVLGPSLTYSCAVWHDGTTTLEDAQANKHELVCRKLDLQPGMRLLDVGCGWGGMVLHAAEHHGVHAVGVTLSEPQAELARKRVAERGLGDRVEVRHADFRDVDDGPYDAISSIGMFEHVGFTELAGYFAAVSRAAAPRGSAAEPRHQPSPSRGAEAPSPVGAVVHRSELHRAVRVPRRRAARDRQRRLRDPAGRVRGPSRGEPARALRVDAPLLGAQPGGELGRRGRRGGTRRARVWRLYMAAAAVGFEHDDNQVHQVLATATTDGASGMPLRPRFT